MLRYDLRHAFTSLQIRAGMSIPELAEQMGHSPQVTMGTYAHVIRDLKGRPVTSPEEQIERARRENGGRRCVPKRLSYCARTRKCLQFGR